MNQPKNSEAKSEESSRKEKEEEERKKRDEMFNKSVEFQCSFCGLSEMCHFKGKDPPFVKNLLEFTEDCFVMIDPFSPRQFKFANNFLVLGGVCSACDREVCVGCSVFFTKRVCSQCAQFNINEFPKDVQKRIVKQAEALSEEKKT